MDVSFSMPAVFSLSAGFRFCTAPEVTVETREFKEGSFEYRRNVASGASVSDITLQRGVNFFNSDFYDWISSYIAGKTDMRRNLLIIQYSDISTGISEDAGLGFLSFQSITSLVQKTPARAWMLFDCIPTHYKAGSDFDAISADISISDLTVKPSFWEEFNTGI
jgi:phage tail-like protein